MDDSCVRVAVEAIGLWFLLSHRVEVEDAVDDAVDDAEVADGRRSELAELGRVEEVGGILEVALVPAVIFSLLTLLGREEEGWSSS